MLIPDVAPLSGAMQVLVAAHTEFQNAPFGTAFEVLERYQRASTQAASLLAAYFSADDVEKIMLTRRHWLLMSTTVGPTPAAVVNDLVRIEVHEREQYLDTLVKQLRAIEQEWSGSTLTLLVPDTNVFLHQDEYFDKINWHEIAQADPVRVLIPMRVVRELDRHKNGPKNSVVSDTCNETVRTRARVSIRRLRELINDPREVAALRPGVEVELITDTLNHRPVDDGDSEIISRVLAASSLIGRPIAIVTTDGGMEFQAKMEGLSVIRM